MPRTDAAAWLLPTAALFAGVLGTDALWVLAAVASNRPCSWLALLAAVDMAVLLRLTGMAPGIRRQLAAVLATALAVALAQWLIVATQVGMGLGLEPLASALRLGPALARQLMLLSLDGWDLAWMVASLPLAALLAAGRRGGREGGAEDPG